MPRPLPQPGDAEIAQQHWAAAPDFYAPDYRRALPGILPAVCELVGRPVAGFASARRHLPAASPRSADRVLLLCLDGLGIKELARGPRLTSLWEDYGTWLWSVFPSITAAALTSIYQGLPPSRHGLVGQQIYKPFPGAVVDMLRMKVAEAPVALPASGFDVNRWKSEPGIVGHPDAPDSVQLLPQTIAGSGLSLFAYGNTPVVGFGDPVEGFGKAAQLLHERTGWVGLYLPGVDSLAHAVGGDSSEVALALHHIEDMLLWMARRLDTPTRDRTALVVCSDHGHADIAHTVPVHGDLKAWLAAHTRAVGFSGRVMHVYGPDDAADVLGWLDSMLGPAGRSFHFEEIAALSGAAPAAGPDAVRQSLGDIVVVLNDGYNFDTHDPTVHRSPFASPLVSQHGGLSFNEMVVPWIVAPLEAVADW